MILCEADMIIDEQRAALAKLREPFEPHQISKLCRPYKKDSPKGNCKVCGGYHGLPALSLDYVGHAALTDRLLKVDPAWNWEPVAWADNGQPCLDRNGGMWIRLTVCGITRLGYGDAQDKTGPNAVKELIGDALRNAAMRFGCALDLWHKGGDLYDGGSEHEPAAPPPVVLIGDDQQTAILNLIQEVGGTLDGFLSYFKLEKLEDLPASQYQRAVAALEKKRKPQEAA